MTQQPNDLTPYQLPDGLLIGYYGDDFTGSTAVMESLASQGLPTVLFLAPPTPEQLAQYEGLRAVGIAGISRSLPTEQMDAELRPAFTALRDMGVPIVHYKICSTFDSSPEIGSIGKAIVIGREIFQSRYIPVVAGAPYLGRYVVFGNLFAKSSPSLRAYRLDRHPTMSRHPVTPMKESDLNLILDEQGAHENIGFCGHCNVFVLESDTVYFAAEGEVVVFDTLTEAHLVRVGEIIWKAADNWKTTHGGMQMFSASSSGLEDALTAYWRTQNLLPEPPTFPKEPVTQIVGVSGSCSPVAARQLEYARAHGFTVIDLTPDPDAPEPLGDAAQIGEIIRNAVESLDLPECRGVLLNTCAGPDDPRLTAHANNPRLQSLDYKQAIGTALGRILRDILEASSVRRVVVAGGDTSGYVAKELGIVALEMVCPMAAGSPLCRADAPGLPHDGMEIVFKGGQMGRQEFYLDVLNGGID